MVYAAELSHDRRAFPSTIFNSHQDPVSGRPCNSPHPHVSYFVSGRVEEFTLLNTRLAPSPYIMLEVVLAACVTFFLYSFFAWPLPFVHQTSHTQGCPGPYTYTVHHTSHTHRDAQDCIHTLCIKPHTHIGMPRIVCIH
jgi:hypothetical protein